MDTSTPLTAQRTMALEMSMSREQTAETTSTASVDMMDAMDDSARASIGSSTPPTSLSSGPSDVADAPKEDSQTEQRRSTRTRASIGTYNLQVLAGTNIHTPTKYLIKNGLIPPPTVTKEPAKEPPKLDLDDVDHGHLNSSLGDYWKLDSPRAIDLRAEAAEKSARRKSSRLDLVKEATTNAVAAATSATSKVLEAGKDVFQSMTDSRSRAQPDKSEAIPKTPTKRARASIASQTPTEEPPVMKPVEVKKKRQYINAGLYNGQVAAGQKSGDKKSRSKKAQKDADDTAPAQRKGSDWFPLPMFHGEKLLNTGRDFQLPSTVLNPLPRTAKPDGWMKISKNRAVDDAHQVYLELCKESAGGEDSTCGCTGSCELDSCLNAIMNYECDDKNCALGAETCTNRPFADLAARTQRGNMFDIGVEVVKTEDRGYGVRAMRAFVPFQIVMEYTGEIITQSECDRRMRKEYKNNECYYLMTFDRKLIIDATRGSMARFVNHSCDPNCEMVMWKVQGKPRMALFAKDNYIEAGDELTYDYNFEAFNESWSQECRCGSRKCRGILGPRPKNDREPKVKELAKSAKKSLKRKARVMLETSTTAFSEGGAAKKRRLMAAKGKFTKAQAKVVAAAIQAEVAASPKKTIQTASRDERAAARQSPGGRSKSTKSRSSPKKSASKTRKITGALQRLKAKVVPSSRRPYQRKAVTTTKVRKPVKATKITKKSAEPTKIASRAYAKRRAKLAATKTPSPRQSPRQSKKTDSFTAAMKLLMADSDSEVFDDEETVSPDSDRVADEIDDQIMSEMAASPARSNKGSPKKVHRAGGAAQRAVPSGRKIFGASSRDVRKNSIKGRR